MGVYRPPSTKEEEWNQVLNKLNEYIELAQVNGGYDTIILGGDLNFRTLSGI